MTKYGNEMSEREDVIGRGKRPRITPEIEEDDDLVEEDEVSETDDEDGYEFFKENEKVFREGF